MDVDAEPCDDFYQFACGGWLNSSININYNAWNTLYETSIHAQDRVVYAMKLVVDGAFKQPLNRGEKAAVELYRQCTDLDTLYNIGLNTWLRFADELGGWLPELFEPREQVDEELGGEFAVEDAILMAFNYTVFPIFWAGVEVSYRDPSRHLITVYEQLPLLILPDKYAWHKELTPEAIYSKSDGPMVTRWLQEIGEDLAEMLNLDRNDTHVRRLIAEMIHLEWMITVSGSSFYKENKDYEVVTIRELQRIAPALDWTYFLSRLVGERLTADEPVALKTGRQWLQTLSLIVGRHRSSRRGLTVINNYIKWKVLLFHLAYVKPKTTDGILWAAMSAYMGRPNQRKEFCFLRTSGVFPLSLPSILRKIDGHDNAEKNKKYVEGVAANVKSEYKKVLEASDVLDNETRRNVLQKLGNASVFVSYSEKMNNDSEMNKEAERIRSELLWSMAAGAAAVYKERLHKLRKPVDPRDWVDTQTAMSTIPIHNYERNLVQLPFDTLRSPIADVDAIDFANYGGVGSIIGHELTHAFDEQGKLHGPTGNLGRGWWSDESRKRFAQREQCFIRHYTQLTGNNDNVQAKAALYENIADNVGLKVAYEAWRKNGRDVASPLAGLEQFSQEQLFFVSYAQTWCALKNQNSREVHMAEPIRVLGSLQNSKEFADAFSCPRHSYMNPKPKCTLW